MKANSLCVPRALACVVNAAECGSNCSSTKKLQNRACACGGNLLSSTFPTLACPHTRLSIFVRQLATGLPREVRRRPPRRRLSPVAVAACALNSAATPALVCLEPVVPRCNCPPSFARPPPVEPAITVSACPSLVHCTGCPTSRFSLVQEVSCAHAILHALCSLGARPFCA